MDPNKRTTEAGTKDFDNVSEEMTECLLQRAEANLSLTSSMDPQPMPRLKYFFAYNFTNYRPVSGTQKNLSLEGDSVTVGCSHDGTVKRLSPPLSRLQKEKVSQSPQAYRTP